MIKIKQIEKNKLSERTLNKMYSILIDAYARTEVDVWGENYIRISKEEFLQLILRGEIFGAFKNNLIIGSIHLLKKTETTYCFGLLSVDFKMTKIGVGRKLINYVENLAVKNGGEVMELEILRPVKAEIEFKKVLRIWYTKLGYTHFSSGTFEEIKPKKKAKAKKLIQPCIFDCYQKFISKSKDEA